MKRIWIVVIMAIAATASAQEHPMPTKEFVISGEVKKPVTIVLDDFIKWKGQFIGDIDILNHLGEKKREEKGLRGVLLTDVLGSVEITAPNPKVLSEYYFVCKASDGYVVVYSWNELFNTSTGASTYIVTSKQETSLFEMGDAILMVSAKDLKTGRRFLKGLASIEVKRAH